MVYARTLKGEVITNAFMLAELLVSNGISIPSLKRFIGYVSFAPDDLPKDTVRIRAVFLGLPFPNCLPVETISFTHTGVCSENPISTHAELMDWCKELLEADRERGEALEKMYISRYAYSDCPNLILSKTGAVMLSNESIRLLKRATA